MRTSTDIGLVPIWSLSNRAIMSVEVSTQYDKKPGISSLMKGLSSRNFAYTASWRNPSPRPTTNVQ